MTFLETFIKKRHHKDKNRQYKDKMFGLSKKKRHVFSDTDRLESLERRRQLKEMTNLRHSIEMEKLQLQLEEQKVELRMLKAETDDEEDVTTQVMKSLMQRLLGGNNPEEQQKLVSPAPEAMFNTEQIDSFISGLSSDALKRLKKYSDEELGQEISVLIPAASEQDSRVIIEKVRAAHG